MMRLPVCALRVFLEANGLRIEGFVMKATGFPPTAAAPGEFRVFPLTDTWIAQPKAKPAEPITESRFLNSRWGE